MKITKRMRKKAKGMNAITKLHFEQGHRVPIYNIHGQDQKKPANAKIMAGIPYVNAANF